MSGEGWVVVDRNGKPIVGSLETFMVMVDREIARRWVATDDEAVRRIVYTVIEDEEN